jgi:hypothetical protein
VKDPGDYLAYIKALIVANPHVVRWKVIREEAQGDMGLFRYRLNLKDNSFLEMFELFKVVREQIEVEKYSFHWQDAVGNLLKRWDNATHHPEVVTNPHHIHDGSEENVQAHRPITAEDVLALVAAEAPK